MRRKSRLNGLHDPQLIAFGALSALQPAITLRAGPCSALLPACGRFHVAGNVSRSRCAFRARRRHRARGFARKRYFNQPVRLEGNQAIVILGARSYAAAPEYRGDTVAAATLARMRWGARLHRQTGLPIMVSGGSPGGTRTSEAEQMKAALEEATPLRSGRKTNPLIPGRVRNTQSCNSPARRSTGSCW
jgi:hypothetical protein